MNRSKKNKNKNKNKNRNKKHADDENSPSDQQDDLPDLLEVETKLPYVIKHSDVMGRYLVASRDLRPGEELMTELPLVVGPWQGCPEVCLGCFKILRDGGNNYTCPRCAWPMCGPNCAGLGERYGHSKAECNLLATSKLKPGEDTIQRYHAIVPLRCLLLRTLSPGCWEKLKAMESHNDIRRMLPHWATNQREVVDRVRDLWGMQQFEEDELHTICGILEVNCFEVGQHGISARALYPSAFLIAHECVPNTRHTDLDNFMLSVRCSTNIERGKLISLSYAYTMQGTMKRREHLKESKFFDCCCPRCTDPTELGTYAGALKCPKCDKGFVLSTAPLDNLAPWRCDNPSCTGYEVAGDSVRSLVEKISDEVEETSANDVNGLEALLTRYRNVLHPNHYHCLGIKHSLSQLYGKSEGFEINQLTEEQLTRKRDICQDLMKVFDVIEPGFSRLRGVTLYELHAPIMMLATRSFERHLCSKQELRAQLKQVADCLEQAGAILSYEPESSMDRGMGMAATEALVQMFGPSIKQRSDPFLQ